MNIEDALLTRQVLNGLKGSAGKSHGQLANECHVSQRRMTHHLFCLEKAGLVITHANARVTLADALAHLAYGHADALEHNNASQNGPAYSKGWKSLMEAVSAHSAVASARVHQMFKSLFGRSLGE